jgi:hypothetical protein
MTGIKDVIAKYKNKSANDLELLATAIYAHTCLAVKTEESVIGGVRKVKGDKYSECEIRKAMEDFPYFGIAI